MSTPQHPRGLAALALLAGALLGGCAGPEHDEEAVGPFVTGPAAPEKPAVTEGPLDLDGFSQQVTAGGKYLVAWRPLPAPIPLNRSFAVEVFVFDPDEPTKGLEEPRVLVDAAMPHHGHGMNRKPMTEPLGGGRHRVEGMLFHMPGRWELYVDVFEGRVSERARFEVMID